MSDKNMFVSVARLVLSAMEKPYNPFGWDGELDHALTVFGKFGGEDKLLGVIRSLARVAQAKECPVTIRERGPSWVVVNDAPFVWNEAKLDHDLDWGEAMQMVHELRVEFG